MVDDHYQHEIVRPTEPLSAWIYLHHRKGLTYIAPHWHQGIELSFTITGMIDDFVINSQHYTTKPGTILVVNSQVVHSIRSVLRANDKAISIIYPYYYVTRLYPQIGDEVIAINQPAQFNAIQAEKYVDLQIILFKIYQNLKVKTKVSNLKLETLTDHALQLLLEYFTRPKAAYDAIYGTKEFEVIRVQEIVKYLNDHYSDKISLNEIARQVNISKEYLTKFFKARMDVTIGQYLNNVRAQKAYDDLLGQTHNLTQIAERNGFSSTRAMNQTFQRIYSKTAWEIAKNKRD